MFLRVYFLLSAFLLLLYTAPESMAGEGSEDYLQSLAKDEISLALKEIGLETCDAFFQEYFETEADDPKITIQAMAYDMGLCVEQDLEKARTLYEQGFKITPFFPNMPIRLALIYEFGPEDLRNPERADFLMKQSAIFLAVTPDDKIKLNIVYNYLADRPIPISLQKHMDWYKEIQKRTPEERRIIAWQLSQEGFKGLNPIWYPVEDGEPSDFSLLTFADIYADPSSDFYDTEKAKHYYFKLHMQRFRSFNTPQNCKSRFTDALDIWSKSKNQNQNQTHNDVISNIINFCQLSNEALFKVAEDFEQDGGAFWRDEASALAIYHNLLYRLFLTDDNPVLKMAVKEKIKFLE